MTGPASFLTGVTTLILSPIIAFGAMQTNVAQSDYQSAVDDATAAHTRLVAAGDHATAPDMGHEETTTGLKVATARLAHYAEQANERADRLETNRKARTEQARAIAIDKAKAAAADLQSKLDRSTGRVDDETSRKALQTALDQLNGVINAADRSKSVTAATRLTDLAAAATDAGDRVTVTVSARDARIAAKQAAQAQDQTVAQEDDAPAVRQTSSRKSATRKTATKKTTVRKSAIKQQNTFRKTSDSRSVSPNTSTAWTVDYGGGWKVVAQHQKDGGDWINHLKPGDKTPYGTVAKVEHLTRQPGHDAVINTRVNETGLVTCDGPTGQTYVTLK